MIEKIDINEVERNLPSGKPAKIRGLDASGNGIVIDVGEIPIPKDSVYVTTMGSEVSSGINKACLLFILNLSNSNDVSIAVFRDGTVYPIVERGEIDYSKLNPSKQISVYAVNGIVNARLNTQASPRVVTFWKIPIVE